MMKSYTTQTTCRVCGSSNLSPLFFLGEQYVSSFAVETYKPGELGKVPIDIELCSSCSLVQAKHSPLLDVLYGRHYWYQSGINQTMRDALADVVRAAESYVDLQAGDVVLDIGSNDGTLLRAYSHLDVFTVGVEPAQNLAEKGSKGTDLLIRDFWSYEAYEFATSQLTDQEGVYGGRSAKVITAIGMFYDLQDPNQFIADIRKALADDGIFIAQLMCLQNMVNSNDIGNFAHEHLEFYSLKCIQYLFDKHDLELIDLETNEVNGQSYRLFVRPKGGSVQPKPGAGRRLVEAQLNERELDSDGFWEKFTHRMEHNKGKVLAYITNAVRCGKSVWVYGASTKGNVILQYYGLDSKWITAASDRNPEKWGLYMVGSNIPIRSEADAREANPDYFLVLPYAFIDEFKEREYLWRETGGKFIVPLPEFRIV